MSVKLLAKYMALKVADALIDWASFPPEPGDRLSRVIVAPGMNPVALRGTKADIDSAARSLATQTQGSVLVLELVEVVAHRTEERN